MYREPELYRDPEQPICINFSADVQFAQVDKLTRLVTKLHNAGVKRAQLHISSPGGSVSRGIDLHNLLKRLPIEFTTHNVGSVDSIANAIYLAGEHRYVSPNANFLMHGVSMGFSNGRANEKQLVNALAGVRRDHASIARTIADRTKLTKKQILRMFLGETIITAEEAVEYGIAHEIRDADISDDAHIFTIVDPPENEGQERYQSQF